MMPFARTYPPSYLDRRPYLQVQQEAAERLSSIDRDLVIRGKTPGCTSSELRQLAHGSFQGLMSWVGQQTETIVDEAMKTAAQPGPMYHPNRIIILPWEHPKMVAEINTGLNEAFQLVLDARLEDLRGFRDQGDRPPDPNTPEPPMRRSVGS